MKWLDSWIQRAYNRARSRDEDCEILVSATPVGRKSAVTLSGNKRVASSYEDSGVINFTVYGANGGKIVETVRYDNSKGSEQVNRYVISDDADFSESLSKIVTMEYLR